MAAVHGKDRFTRHHVDRIRLRVDFTESKHQRVAVGFRFGDGFAADAAESMDGVAAVAHWGGAGMVRLAVEGNGVAALTDDGVDHADGLLVGFQHAALFDMQFNEGFNIPARRQRGGGQAKATLLHSIDKRHAFGVFNLTHVRRVSDADDIFAAPEDVREAAAFFFR